MKVAIVGTGALGSYYGARLARAGHQVHFLLRSDLAHVRAHGVQILSPTGDFHVRPIPAADPREIGHCDLVVIGLKTTANDQFPRLIPPLVGPSTAVLTLQNGLGNEEALARIVPAGQILGGLCFVCINRIGPGVIQHIAHGRIVLGEFAAPLGDRARGIATAFIQSGVPCEAVDNLAHAHWQKLVWNIPFNGLGVASAAGLDSIAAGRVAAERALQPCLSSDRLLADPQWHALVRQLMSEVIQTARTVGHDIPHEYAQFQIDRTLEMGPYFASTLIDFAERRPLEVDSLFVEPWRHAIAARVETPLLGRLCGVLRDLAARNGQAVTLPTA